MPESFDGMLAELADAAVDATPLPDIAAVMARGRERAVRRRIAASAVSFVVLAVAGGVLAAVASHFDSGAGSDEPAGNPSYPNVVQPYTSNTPSAVPTGDSTSDGGPSAVNQGPSVDSSGSGSTGTSGLPDGAGAAENPQWRPFAGIWQPEQAAGLDVIVYPDGAVALGAPDKWDFCYGALGGSEPSGAFQLDEVQCDDFGVTSGLTVSLSAAAAGAKDLEIHVPATTGRAPYVETYQLYKGITATSPSQLPGIIAAVSGPWVDSVDGGHTVTVGGDGSVMYSAYDQNGGLTPGSGVSPEAFDGGIRTLVQCADGAVRPTPCGIVQLMPGTFSGTLTVITPQGVETLSREG